MSTTNDEQRLFQAAIELPPSDRAAYLDRECAGNAVLRARLEALLAAHDQPDTPHGVGAEGPLCFMGPDRGRETSEADAVGRTLGRYRILKRLGEGGCGVVYVAEQTEPVRRRVALKLIKPGMDSQAVIARFEAERQALAMMDHPNIAKALDAGTSETGRPYFVLELVQGIRITEYCEREKLPLGDRLGLFIQVCQAIQHAHQKGVIHRDIKPSNILVTLQDGLPVPKVIDFGIAKAVEGRLTDSPESTHLHPFLGTPAYMSPEQAEMSGRDIDTRSDIYSLGVVLYELLTGVTPFDPKELHALSLEAMRQTIREKEPPRPSTRFIGITGTPPGRWPALSISHLPSDLDWIVMKCLEKDRSRRYETAYGLAADVKRHLSSEPVLARPPRWTDRLVKALRRHRSVVLAGAVVGGVLVVGAVVSLFQAREAHRARRWAEVAQKAEAQQRLRAERALEASEQQRERAAFERWSSQLSEARSLRMAAIKGARIDGARLLRDLAARPGLTEEEKLALREEALGQFALVDILPPGSWVAKPDAGPLAWNSSLDRFISLGPSNRIRLGTFPSGEPLADFPSPPGAIVETIRFSPRGTFVAAQFRLPAEEIWFWQTEGQQLILRGKSVSGFEFAPDDSAVLLLTPQGVGIQPLGTAASWRVLQPGRRVAWAGFSPDLRRIAVLTGDELAGVEIWDTETGDTRSTLSPGFPIKELAWHPGGRTVAVGGDRGRLGLLPLISLGPEDHPGKGFLPLTGHEGAIGRVRFSPDGRLLLSDSLDRSSILWDAISGRALLREHRMRLSDFDATGGQVLASRERPGAEAPAGLVGRIGYRTLGGGGQTLGGAGVWASGDGRLLAIGCRSEPSGSEDYCVLQDTVQGQRIGWVMGGWACFSPDSRTLYVFTRNSENQVRAYDVSPEAIARAPVVGTSGRGIYHGDRWATVSGGTITADGKTLVIAAGEAVVLLDLTQPSPPVVWGKSAQSVSVSPDGKWIATMSRNQVPVLSRTSDGRSVFWGEPRSRIELGPDNRHFCLATETGLQVFGLETLQPLVPAIPLEVPGVVPPLAFSPDGRAFATTCNRWHPRLFETRSGRLLATFPPPREAPLNGAGSLNFSPDGQWLLALKSDGETSGWHLPRIRDELFRIGLDWTFSEDSMADADRPLPGSPSERLRRLTVRPERSPNTDSRLIDLSHYFNASLVEHWHAGEGSSDLSELPQGVQSLVGVPFDLRGLIQCGSSSRFGAAYPRHITDIPIRQSVRRIHFLHAAIHAAGLSNGTVVGGYTLRADDGAVHEVILRAGYEVADWWSPAGENSEALEVAWIGKNAASRSAGRSIRLFKTTWTSPTPGAVVSTLDLVATHDRAAPFLLAVTVE